MLPYERPFFLKLTLLPTVDRMRCCYMSLIAYLILPEQPPCWLFSFIPPTLKAFESFRVTLYELLTWTFLIQVSHLSLFTFRLRFGLLTSLS